MNRFFKFKTLLFLMLFAFAGQNAWAENYSWFNFDVYVKAKVKTADGLVYDNPETGTVYAKLACNSSEKENHEYAHTHPSNASDVQSYSLDATLHAIPNTGFKFLYWTKEDGSIISASETEQNDGKATVACNATLRCFYGEKGSGDSNHDASHKSLIQQYGTYSNIFNYYAVFEPILASIAVKSNNTNLGRAICSKYDNDLGDEVTIKAYCIDYDTKFLGWEVNGEIISRENPYTFTVTNKANNSDETIIYTAVFENGYNFHRIRNYVTKNYLNAISDDGNASTLVSGGPITSLELNTNDLNDVMYEAGSIVDIYYARIPNDTRYYYDYFVQGAKASKYYDFDPDDPTSSTGGVFLRMPYDAKTYTNTWAFATANEGGFRFTDDNGTPKITMGERPESQWYIECIDKDLETKENYFSLDPDKLVEVGGKYYTTLRTSWNILFNPEQMTPYIVSSVKEASGTFEMEPLTGNIIPAGTPVVIETKSNDIEENRMVPTLTAAASGAVPSENKLISSDKYFPNQDAPDSNCKALTVYNGKLVFGGDALSKVNGNEAYLRVANEVALEIETPETPEVTLAELLASGDTQNTYIVTDLTAVEIVNDDQLIIAKDNNGYATKDVMPEGDYVDYMHTASGITNNDLNIDVPDEYDQSNWIALRVPAGALLTTDMKGKHLTGVKGRLVNTANPEFVLDKLPDTEDEGVASTALNVFIPASFKGTQPSTVGSQKTYFFVQPKPMEMANITWAQWDGEKFISPVHDDAHPDWNQAELVGSFELNGAYLEAQDGGGLDMSTLKAGHAYAMTPAVIKLKTGNYAHVYVLGNVNGTNWNTNKGVEMETSDGTVYTAIVTANNSGDGYGYFSFTKKLGATWEDINSSRFGSEASGDYWDVLDGNYNTPLTLRYWGGDTRSFRVPEGTYRLTVTLANGENFYAGTVVIQRAGASQAPRRKADGDNGYVVYPISMTQITSEENNVVTGVSTVGGDRVAVSRQYVNVAGVRASQPWNGVNIVITTYSDGTTTATKIVK